MPVLKMRSSFLLLVFRYKIVASQNFARKNMKRKEKKNRKICVSS